MIFRRTMVSQVRGQVDLYIIIDYVFVIRDLC